MFPASLISLLNITTPAADLIFTSPQPFLLIDGTFLETLIASSLSYEDYNTWDILSVIANSQPNFIETMVSLQNTLQILIIDEPSQYTAERINVCSSVACANELLSQGFALTNVKILCAINRKGVVRSQFYQHLDKCLKLFDDSQMKNVQRLCRYFFNCSKQNFEKINEFFNVFQYIDNIINYGEVNSHEESRLWTAKTVERLAYLNTNEISPDIFQILFANYYQFADFRKPGRPWLKSFFEKFERKYSSADLATVFCEELPVFCEEYYMSDDKETYVAEFFEYEDFDRDFTYQIFFEDNVFFVELAKPKELLDFIVEKFFELRTLRQNSKNYGVFGLAVEYLLAFKNLCAFSQEDFQKIRHHPQEILNELITMKCPGFVFGPLPENVRENVKSRFLWETSERIWSFPEVIEEETDESGNDVVGN